MSAWLGARLEGLTGTDAAAILGLTPWKTPLEVWAEKTRRVVPEDIGHLERIRWGNLLEPVIIGEALERTGREALAPDDWDAVLPHGRVRVYQHGDGRKAMIHSTRWPWLRVTPDFLVGAWKPIPWLEEQHALNGAGIGETKAVGSHVRAEWRDGAPVHYRVQVMANALAAGLSWGTFGTLIGGQDLRVFDLELDEGRGLRLVAALERFWVEHVQADRPPPATDSERDAAVLQKLHPNRSAGPALALEGAAWDVQVREMARLEERRAGLRAELRDLDKRHATLKNGLVQAAGDHAEAVTPSGARVSISTRVSREHTVRAKTSTVVTVTNPEPEEA